MFNLRVLCLACALPAMAISQGAPKPVQTAIEAHILPTFETLATTSATLAETAEADCLTTSKTLRTAYHDAFDAWIAASHLRFGPTEEDNRAFALAFWPDSRGKTPKALNGLLGSADPIGTDAESYVEVSIAARGLYALEFLLYDEFISVAGTPEYRCELVQTVTKDIANTTQDIYEDWRNGYADLLAHPHQEGPYQTGTEALQEVFKALYTGVEFSKDTRLGRPLGSFDKPRPKRAESWRSGRSLHNVEVSLASLQQLAAIIALEHPSLAKRLDAAFAFALEIAEGLEDPTFANVTEVQGWFEVDTLRQSLEAIREILIDELAPELGVTEGFNALDGD